MKRAAFEAAMMHISCCLLHKLKKFLTFNEGPKFKIRSLQIVDNYLHFRVQLTDTLPILKKMAYVT